MPDFSKLPNELLHIVASHVGQPALHEQRKLTISPHLLKMRLVCKKFSSIASATFLSLVQKEEHSSYRILNLPPKSGNLDELFSACCPGGIMSTIVTSVKYNVATAAQLGLDDAEWLCEALDSRHRAANCGCNVKRHDWEDNFCEELVNRNTVLFQRLCKDQDSFVDVLGQPASIRKLKSIFSQLARVSTILLDIYDFWEGASWDTPEPERDAVSKKFYRIGLPTLLEAISAGKATKLEFTGIGSYALGGLHPLVVNKLVRKKDFLKCITTVELVMTHCDDVDGVEMGEPYLAALKRGDRLGLLLSCVKNLKCLSLSYKDECGFQVGSELERDDVWIEELLQAQSWNFLRCFSLKKYYTNGSVLKEFLSQHSGSLTTITLEDIHISDSDCLDLLNSLRNSIPLTNANIRLSRSRHCDLPDLKKIIDDYDTALSPDVDLIDVGPYVLYRAREVIELD